MRFATQVDIPLRCKTNHLSNAHYTILQNSSAPWKIHLQSEIRSILIKKTMFMKRQPVVIQFPSLHCKLPSSLRKNLNSDYFSSSECNSKNSNEMYSNQEIFKTGQSQFPHNSFSKQQERQSPASNQSLSPRVSRQSSPGLHPFGLEDY